MPQTVIKKCTAWGLGEDAFVTGEPSSTDPDSQDGEALILLDPEKVTLTGTSSNTASSTIDSDITEVKDRFVTGGQYIDIETDANGDPVVDGERDITIWLETYDFTETDNVTGSSSTQSNSDLAEGSQVHNDEGTSNQASTIGIPHEKLTVNQC